MLALNFIFSSVYSQHSNSKLYPTEHGFYNIKVRLALSKKNCVICSIESPLKIMKNAFYFILKAFFLHKIFNFLPSLFRHIEKTA